jgi:hypothetical protein
VLGASVTVVDALHELYVSAEAETHEYYALATAEWASQVAGGRPLGRAPYLSTRALGLMDHLMRMRTTQARMSILGGIDPGKDGRNRSDQAIGAPTSHSAAGLAAPVWRSLRVDQALDDPGSTS